MLVHACSIWTTLRLKEQLVKLVMEHSHAQRATGTGTGGKVSAHLEGTNAHRCHVCQRFLFKKLM